MVERLTANLIDKASRGPDKLKGWTATESSLRDDEKRLTALIPTTSRAPSLQKARFQLPPEVDDTLDEVLVDSPIEPGTFIESRRYAIIFYKSKWYA
jgi:hypothetical protein